MKTDTQMLRCAKCGKFDFLSGDGEFFCSGCEVEYQAWLATQPARSDHPSICLCYDCVGENG